jgi:hypothetical protein
VLLLMRGTPEFAAAWLGAVRAGAVAIALNNKLNEAEYRHILADSGARLAIVEDIFAAARSDLTAELARDGRIAVAGDASGLPAWRDRLRTAPEIPALDVRPETPAFLLYSSGTTGKPKGIVHAHRGFGSLGLAFRALDIGEGDRIFTTSKFFSPMAWSTACSARSPWARPQSSTRTGRIPRRSSISWRDIGRPPCSAYRPSIGGCSPSPIEGSLHSGRCGASSPAGSASPANSWGSGTRPLAASCSTSTACPKPSAPA